MRVRNSSLPLKGSYLLVIQLPQEQDTTVGSLGLVHFSAGYYAYVGSALGGFKSRLNRHLRTEKTPKWHVDYLLPHENPKWHIDNRLQKPALKSIIICETNERVECAIAEALSRRFESIRRFGSSDCKCPSHLFFDAKSMEPEIRTELDSLGLRSELLGNLGELKF